MGVDEAGRLVQGEGLQEPFVEEFAQCPGDAVAGSRTARQPGAQVCAQPFTDEGEAALRLELVARVGEDRVQLSDAAAQEGVGEVRAVHRRSDEARVEVGHVEVEHALAEAARGGG